MSGGGGVPQDNSVQLEQMREAQANRQQARQDALDKQNATKLANLRTAARGAGGSEANAYFQSQGLDPSSYEGQIQQKLNDIAAGISDTDPNPSSYYKDVGQQVYDAATSAGRATAQTGLDRVFPTNFDYTRIPTTAADPTVNAIEAEQRQTAENYLNNLKARGVITDAGYSAGEKNLDTQSAGVLARLQEIGSGALATGRQSLDDIRNQAYNAASNLKLGQSFDPSSYSSQLDTAYNNFINNLGTTIRGKVGTANLFDTSGLGAIAGAGQFGQNTAYDPKAIAGIMGNTTDTTDNSTSQANRTGATGVF
jgi:hypothetical protein